MIDQEKKKEIIEIFNKRVPAIECPMCHGNQFTIVDGYSNFMLQDKPNSISLGPGSIIPSIPIVCNNCGFIGFHALGSLGLLPKVEPENNVERSDE